MFKTGDLVRSKSYNNPDGPWFGPMKFVEVYADGGWGARCDHPSNGFGGFCLTDLELVKEFKVPFKKGDKVECLKSYDDQFTKGKIYTIKRNQLTDNGYIGVDIALDDKGSTSNGWSAQFFKLVTKEINVVNYHALNDSIVLNYNGKTVVVAKGDSRYEAVLQAIRDHALDDIPAIVEIERGFEGSGLELRDGILYENDVAIPTELNGRILKYKEAQLPYDSLLRFWDNLKKNPSFNARKMLFAFLENNGHPLTEDGCFIAYRGVTEDFKDLHTGTFDNKPGNKCEMARDLVDDNPNNTCSAGLHVACFEYAKGFGPRLVEVKVNPEDVVAVPTDYNGTKMRTCKFEVVQECANIRTELLYGKADPVVSEANEEEYEEEEADENEDRCCTESRENDGFANFCSDCGADLN